MTEISVRRIVVGIDGSAESLAALGWALRSAAADRQTVEVIHCWKAQTLSDAFLSSAHELHRASECMLDNEVAAALAVLDDRPDVVRSSIRGNPAIELVARAAGAELLVLGRHRMFRLRDKVFGQVADRCIRNAGCPVVIVDRDGTVVERPLTSTRSTLG